MSTAKAARAVGIHTNTLYKYVEDGLITPSIVLPSGQYRWTEKDIERLRSGASA